MLLHRRILLVLVLLLVPSSISLTLGYGLYLRSDGYRADLERQVSRQLRMSVAIGRVQPLTGDSRAFEDIRVRLGDRIGEVFRCRRAVWHDVASGGDAVGSLDLADGWLLVGKHQWTQSEYAEVLRSGLGQDAARLGLRKIYLDGIDLEWVHPDITLTLGGARGEIAYEGDGAGQATLVAYALNGRSFDEPIKVIARFTPGEVLAIHSADLDVPLVEFARLGLDPLLGGEVTQGRFAGRIGFRDRGDDGMFTLSGTVRGAAFDELTRRIPGGPYHGRVDLSIDEAEFVGGLMRTLRFSGRLAEFDIAELLPALGDADLQSKFNLRVHQASIRERSIEYVSAEGQAGDLSLAAICRMVGRGMITGRLGVKIKSLQIVDDAIRHAEIEFEAVPPPDEPGTIDKSFLQWAAQQWLGFDVGRFLPDQIEYARLGMTAIIDGDTMRIGGTHGDGRRTILTIRVLGREIQLVKAPDETYDIAPMIAWVRERAADYDAERVRSWWELMHTPPAEP